MNTIPIIDIAPFLCGGDRQVARAIGDACAEFGFFCVANHGVDSRLQNKIEKLSHEFFRLPLAEKMKISMEFGGRAWRGYFPVGGELTSGHADLKEGLYLGEELSAEDPRVGQGLPLHGPNLFPARPAEFREVILQYFSAMTGLAHKLMEAISLSLDLDAQYFRRHFTGDPTSLFRIFHYPPSSAEAEKKFPWGVGEHTDYGVLTILQQDQNGGLEVKTKSGWVPVPPQPGVFVCNVGDMLDYLTRGRYRSLPHRVKNTSGRSRLSFPYFFDPGFAAKIEPLPAVRGQTAMAHDRWDGQDLYAFQGTYGEYLLKKIAKVFPDLAKSKL